MENDSSNEIATPNIKGEEIYQLPNGEFDTKQVLREYSSIIYKLENELKSNKNILINQLNIIEKLEIKNRQLSQQQSRVVNYQDLEVKKPSEFYSIFKIGFIKVPTSRQQELSFEKLRMRVESKIKNMFSERFITRLKKRRKIYKLFYLFLQLPSLRPSLRFFST